MKLLFLVFAILLVQVSSQWLTLSRYDNTSCQSNGKNVQEIGVQIDTCLTVTDLHDTTGTVRSMLVSCQSYIDNVIGVTTSKYSSDSCSSLISTSKKNYTASCVEYNSDESHDFADYWALTGWTSSILYCGYKSLETIDMYDDFVSFTGYDDSEACSSNNPYFYTAFASDFCFEYNDKSSVQFTRYSGTTDPNEYYPGMIYSENSRNCSGVSNLRPLPDNCSDTSSDPYVFEIDRNNTIITDYKFTFHHLIPTETPTPSPTLSPTVLTISKYSDTTCSSDETKVQEIGALTDTCYLITNLMPSTTLPYKSMKIYCQNGDSLTYYHYDYYSDALCTTLSTTKYYNTSNQCTTSDIDEFDYFALSGWSSSIVTCSYETESDIEMDEYVLFDGYYSNATCKSDEPYLYIAFNSDFCFDYVSNNTNYKVKFMQYSGFGESNVTLPGYAIGSSCDDLTLRSLPYECSNIYTDDYVFSANGRYSIVTDYTFSYVSAVPTSEPSVKPTNKPTKTPTTKPTIKPTQNSPTHQPTMVPSQPSQEPTLPPVSSSSELLYFTVEQNLVGVSTSSFESSSSNYDAFTETVETILKDYETDVYISSVGSTTAVSMNSNERELSNTDTCKVTYSINCIYTSGSSSTIYNDLVSTLDATVASGDFVTALIQTATSLSATSLLGVTNSTVVSTSTYETVNPNSSGSGSSGISTGAAVGIAIGVIAGLVLIYCIYSQCDFGGTLGFKKRSENGFYNTQNYILEQDTKSPFTNYRDNVL